MNGAYVETELMAKAGATMVGCDGPGSIFGMGQHRGRNERDAESLAFLRQM